MKVLIVYYSTYGHVYRMATLVAEGVKEIPGAQPVVRTVPELIPQSVIESREDMKAGREMQRDVPLVTLEDFREVGAIAFGTPTRFGNVAAQLKNQIDQLTSLWLKGELEGKQRYRCRACPQRGRTFLLDYAYPGQSQHVKHQIVEMAMKASGIRDTARVLHVSPTTVIKELKKKNLTCNR